MPPKTDNYSPKLQSDSSGSRLKRVRSSPEFTDKNIKKVVMSVDRNISPFSEPFNVPSPQFFENLSQIMNNLLDNKLASLATKADFKILHDDYVVLKEENRKLRNEIDNLKCTVDKVINTLDDVRRGKISPK